MHTHTVTVSLHSIKNRILIHHLRTGKCLNNSPVKTKASFQALSIQGRHLEKTKLMQIPGVANLKANNVWQGLFFS